MTTRTDIGDAISQPRSTPAFFYFDLGNVLLNFDHHRAARQMAEVAGVDAGDIWRIVFESDLETRFETGVISASDFYKEFCRATNTEPDYQSLLTAASAIFEVNASIVPVVGYLCAAGYRMGVLSNTNEAHWEYVFDGRYPFLRLYFQVFALSYQLGAMKPDAHIYTAAAELAGVEPPEIFFVDDRPDNVTAACRAGYDAILFETASQTARELRRRGVRTNY